MKLIELIRESSSVEPMLVEEQERLDVRQRWLTTFAQGVKSAKGVWVFNGYMWHCFSFKMAKSLEGIRALSAYQSTFSASAFVFDEDLNEMFSFRPDKTFPDLTALKNDYYVCHHNMKWTMVFTHEQPSIGPFFAEGGMQNNQSNSDY